MELNLRTVFSTFMLMLGLTAAKADSFTAVQSGLWSDTATWGGPAPTFNILVDQISIASGIDVELDNDLMIDGFFAELDIQGNLHSGAGSEIVINNGLLTGDGMIDVAYLEFGAASNSTFTGDFITDVLVNNTTVLILNGVTTVNDSLILYGNINIQSGDSLKLMDDAVVAIYDGVVEGSGEFYASTMYNVAYVGAEINTGIEATKDEIDTVWVNLNNAADNVILESELTVHGHLAIESGYLVTNGNRLNLMGDLFIGSTSSIKSDDQTTLAIMSQSTMTGSLVFEPNNNDVDTIIVDFQTSGEASFDSDVNVVSELRLVNGDATVESSYSLNLRDNATVWVNNGMVSLNGSAQLTADAGINIKYTGDTKDSGHELDAGTIYNLELLLNDDQQNLMLMSDLIIEDTAQLEMGKMVFNGNDAWLNGYIYANDDLAYFNGDSNANLYINGEVNQYTKIFFENEDMMESISFNMMNDSEVEFGGNIWIDDSLSLNSGVVIIGSNSITLDDDAMIHGGNDMSYINTVGQGRVVAMVGANSSTIVNFPVGNDDGYSPIRIKNDATVDNHFMVRSFSQVYQDGYTGYDLSNSAQLVAKTWDIDAEDTANINVTLEAQWNTSMEVNNFDRTDAYISHYVNGAWDLQLGDASSMVNANTYTISRAGITSMSPFAVHNEGALGINNEVATSLNIFPNPVKDVMIIENNAEAATIELYDLSGKRVMNVPGNTNSTRNSIDISNLTEGIYIVKLSSGSEAIATERIVKL